MVFNSDFSLEHCKAELWLLGGIAGFFFFFNQPVKHRAQGGGGGGEKNTGATTQKNINIL